jgi:RNA recognition motif-containing protein
VLMKLQVASIKIIRNKMSQQSEGYGFIEFHSRAAAEHTLMNFNGRMMPNIEQAYKLNWASSSSGDKRGNDGPDHTIFVGDLAADVTDYMLEEAFKASYPSVRGAKVVTDRVTGCSKGYGFVRFGDISEQTRAMTEMNGMMLSTRQMRIGAATSKKDMGAQQTYATNGKSFRDHFRVFFSEFLFVLFCTWPTSYAISLFFLDDCVLLRIFSF